MSVMITEFPHACILESVNGQEHCIAEQVAYWTHPFWNVMVPVLCSGMWWTILHEEEDNDSES